MLLGQWFLCITTVLTPICWAEHVLCTALPSHTLSLGCPFPAMSQLSLPLPPCLCHLYALLPCYSFSFYFPPNNCSHTSFFLIYEKWSRSDTTSRRSHNLWLCPAFLMHPVHWCPPVTGVLQPGQSTTSQASEKFSHWWRYMMHSSVGAGQKGGIENF